MAKACSPSRRFMQAAWRVCMRKLLYWSAHGTMPPLESSGSEALAPAPALAEEEDEAADAAAPPSAASFSAERRDADDGICLRRGAAWAGRGA